MSATCSPQRGQKLSALSLSGLLRRQHRLSFNCFLGFFFCFHMNSHIQNTFTGVVSPTLVHKWVIKGREDCIKISSMSEGKWFEKRNLRFLKSVLAAHQQQHRPVPSLRIIRLKLLNQMLCLKAQECRAGPESTGALCSGLCALAWLTQVVFLRAGAPVQSWEAFGIWFSSGSE